MFKKIAAEALGLSDIGIIVSPAEFHKVDADDYLFHEDGEKIFFLIKSKKDEYCFTNFGLIHVDGESAVSSKRAIRRYEYVNEKISGASIETAGTIDLDIELKFTMGGKVFSIDVKKAFIEQLKDIYKALIAIGRLQDKDETARQNALRVLDVTASMYRINQVESGERVVGYFNALLDNLNDAMLERHKRRDFSEVFSKYIRS